MNKKDMQKSETQGIYSKKAIVILGSILVLLTVLMELMLIKVFPTFINMFNTFGVPTASVISYQKFTSLLLIFLNGFIVAAMISPIFTHSKRLSKGILIFYGCYLLILLAIFIGAIFVLYSNQITMGG